MCSLHLTHPNWSSGQPTVRPRGAVWGIGALLKGRSLHLTHPKRIRTWSSGHHRTAPGEQLGVRCLAQGHFSRGIELNSCRPETRTRKL